jgi:hypothetical protein
MRKTWTVIALLGVLIGCGGKSADTSSGGGTDTTPAVAKNPWGSFKVGSYETMKATTTTEVAGNKTNMATETKMTLINLTADKATVETATTVMGNTSKTNIDIPLTATQTATPPTGSTPNANVKSGTETLTIAGKSLNCKWTETESEAGGNKTVAKVWTSEEVPGFVVKMVTSTKGTMSSEMVSEVTDFKVM